MTGPGATAREAARPVRYGPGTAGSGPEGDRPLIVAGTLAACAATACGLAISTALVLVGRITSPADGISLAEVLRAGAALWLAGQHVSFTGPGVGTIGLLPLGLVLLPAALLWHAARWVVRVGKVTRLRHVGYVAIALAVPYALLNGGLAVAGRSPPGSSSVLESFGCGLLLALAVGGLGAARALATWPSLVARLPERARPVVLGAAGVLACLIAIGSLLAGSALAVHLSQAEILQRSLAPGIIGTALLLLLQIVYLPNAVVWAIAFALGPGFAFGTATVLAPTGATVARLPAFPMLAALSAGPHTDMSGWLEPLVLAMPYLAGGFGGLLIVRAASRLSFDVAALHGLGCGALSGAVLCLLAAASGGPLGHGRLAAVGPSAWQVGVVSALEIGIAAAVTASTASYLTQRRSVAAGQAVECSRLGDQSEETGHVIYLDPWAGGTAASRRARRDPSALQ